jgi:hypothetical protein
MSEQQETPQGASRCVCNEMLGHIQEILGVSPTVRQHLTNSRIEFLKAIRGVIDEHIERLSTTTAKGAKIAVE